MSMIEPLFGEGYQVVQLFVNPSDSGHTAVARNRTYIFIFPQSRTDYILDAPELYARISHEIQKVSSTMGRDYMVSCRNACWTTWI